MERDGCGAERFLARGRVVAVPRQRADRDMLVEHLASLVLAPEEEADEREVSARIAALADDVARWRRDLVEAGLLGRRQDGSRYWRERVTAHDVEPTARIADPAWRASVGPPARSEEAPRGREGAT